MMRYPRVSPELRRYILQQPEVYPLRVSFLGKTGLLSFQEVDFLLRNGVDISIDEKQIVEILAEQGEPMPLGTVEETAPRQLPEKATPTGYHRPRMANWWIRLAVAGVAALLALVGPIRVLRRLTQARRR